MNAQGDGQLLNTEETEIFLDTPTSPSRPDSRIRGRIMAAGYKYNLLEESSGETTGVRPKRRCDSRLLLVWSIVCFLFFMTPLLLFFLLGSTNGDDCSSTKLCVTSGCIQASASILSKMDETADPCTDIYQYACGGWMRDTIIPPGRSTVKIFSQISDKNSDFLKKFLEDKSTKFRGRKSTAIAKLKTAYRSCMDMDTLKELGPTKLVELINSLSSWTVAVDVNNITTWNRDHWNLQDVIERSHLLWGSGLFEYGIGADSKNTSHWIMTFSQAGLSLSYREQYFGNNTSKLQKGFLDYSTQVAVLLGGDAESARARMKEVFDFETKLAKIFVPKEELIDPLKNYHKMTVKELQTLMGSWIDIKRYLTKTSLDFSDTDKVLVIVPPYFRNLSRVVKETDKEILANYLTWHTIKHFLHYLPDEFVKAQFPLSVLETGVKDVGYRFKFCAAFAKKLVGFAASAAFVEVKFNESVRTSVTELMNDIREEFITNLDTVSWLDNVTRTNLREKAKAIYFQIGYPDWILDTDKLDERYEKLEVKEHQIFDNHMAYIKYQSDRGIEKFVKKPDKKEWSELPITVNAFYSQNFNKVIIPAGILQPPFYENNAPLSYLFSTMGMGMGHELTHGFDNSGRLYDKNGNFGNLWTPATTKMYKNNAECIENQYGNFTLQGHHLNGKTTLGENIADNGGFRLAYLTYQKRKSSQPLKLPGIKLTDDQLFFVGFSQLMCAISTPEYEINTITTDVHSNSKFRVKGVIANMPEFNTIFKCPEHKSKQDVCRVW